jgi:hypothetical protein
MILEGIEFGIRKRRLDQEKRECPMTGVNRMHEIRGKLSRFCEIRVSLKSQCDAHRIRPSVELPIAMFFLHRQLLSNRKEYIMSPLAQSGIA